MKLKIKDICIISIFSILLFIQEELLNFLPNVNLTIFLILLYSKKFKTIKTLLIILIYCLLDSIFMNSFNIIYVLFTMIALSIIPILTNTIFKKINNIVLIAVTSILFSLLYCWIYAAVSVLIYDMNFKTYMIMDVPFEIVLAISSFISTILLYKPLSKIIDYYL